MSLENCLSNRILCTRMPRVIVILLLLGACCRGGYAISTASCSPEDVGLRFSLDSSCSQFLVCMSNRTIALRTCPRGLYFNEELQVCDFATRVPCGVEWLTASEQCSGCDCDVCCGPSATTTPTPEVTTSTCEPPLTTPNTSPPCSTAPVPTTVEPVSTRTPPPCTDGPPTSGGDTTETPLPSTVPTAEPPATETPTQPPQTPSPSTVPTAEPPATETPTQPPQTPSPSTVPTAEPPATETPTQQPQTPSPSTLPTVGPPATETPTQPPQTPSPSTAPTVGPPPTQPPSPTPSPNTSSTSGPTPSPHPPSDCQCCEVRDGTILVQEGNCQNFLVCLGGEGTVMSCPNNLLFNNATGECDFPENVNCPWEVLPPSGAHAGPSGTYCASGGRCVRQRDGYQLPDESNACSSTYYVCQCECEVPRDCSASLMFNPRLGVCDWPSNFGCDNTPA